MQYKNRKFFAALTACLCMGFLNPLSAEDQARLVVQETERNQGEDLCFNFDGRLLISRGEKSVRIWDRDGRLLRKFVIPEGVRSLAVSPTEDTLALGQGNGPVTLYDFRGKQLLKFAKDSERVSSLVYFADGRSIATYNGLSIYIWDTSNGTRIRSLQAGHTGINRLAASPDGQWIAAGGGDGHISLYRVSDGAQIFKRNDDGDIRDILFLPDGKSFITAHSGKGSSMLFFTKKIRKIGFWDLAGKEIDSVSAHDEVYSLSLGQGSQAFVSGTASGYLEFWNFAGKRISAYNTQPGGSEYTSRTLHRIAFDKDSGLLVIAGWDHALRGYDAQMQPMFVNKPDYAGTSSIGFDKQGSIFVFGAGNKLGLWTDKMQQPTISKVNHYSEDPFAVSSDGSRIAMAASGYSVSVLDSSGKLIHDFLGHKSEVKAINYLTKRSQFMTVSRAGLVVFLNHDGYETARWQTDIAETHKAAVHEESDQIAISADDGSIKLYSLAGAFRLSVKNPTRYPWGMDFSADGKVLAVATFGRGAQFWETSSGKLQSELPGTGANEVSVLSLNYGKGFAVGNMAGSLLIVDNSGKVRHNLVPFGNSVDAIAISPNGQYLMAGSYVSGIVFYDTKTYAESARFITAANGDFAFGSADGRYDYSGTGDRVLHWVVGNEAIPIGQLKDRYHTPGLLREFIGIRQATPTSKPNVTVSKNLVGKVFQIKHNGDVVIFTKVSGSLRAGKKLKILNGANYVDATISNTLHTNVTAKVKGSVAVGNPVFE